MIIWLDVETTGLDERNGALLEVGLAYAQDFDPCNLGAAGNVVIKTQLDALAGKVDQYVIDMHTKNNLWAETQGPNALELRAAEDLLLQWVPEQPDGALYTLAGNSVHFDYRWLRHHMPRFAARFAHRLLDVSAIQIFCTGLGMQKPPKGEAHRAIADLRESALLLKTCREFVSSIKYEHNVAGAA